MEKIKVSAEGIKGYENEGKSACIREQRELMRRNVSETSEKKL